MINKKSVLFMAVIIISLAAGLFLRLKYTGLFAQLKKLDKDYKKVEIDLKKKDADFENSRKQNLELKEKYDKIQKDFQALSVDKDNMVSQIKNLMTDKSKVSELEASSEAMQKDIETLEAKQKILLKQNIIFRDKIKKLMAEGTQLSNENVRLQDELSKERDASPVKNLEKQNVALKKENAELEGLLKKTQSEMSRLRETTDKSKSVSDKSEREAKDLRDKLNKLNKNYASAVRKNRILEQKVIQTPKKFTEIARQNKMLIRQTANMHYNLGVFYMKNKEYSRAVAEFEKSIELTPDDAYAHFNIGYIYSEYLANRPQAIEHFRQYLRVVKSDDKDVDWVKKYILTWDTYDAKRPID